MKTLIVGAGVIGVIYGWALTEAGVDVTHFVRNGKKDKFKDGVTLDLLDERKGHVKNNVAKYAPRCVEEISPADGYELIIVPTNSYQTEEVVKTLVPVSGNALFFIFAANWEGADFIDRLLPRERYLMGYPDGGGTIRNGAYWTNLGGEVHLGEVDGEPSGKLEMVKALFARADIQPDVQENILHWLWLHNAMSIGIWAGFAKYREVKPFLKDADLLRECYASTKELLELCARRGVDLKKYPEVGTFNLPVWAFIPLFRLLYTYNKSMQRFTAHAADSLQEARENLSSIMQTADELHFDMPHTKALGVYLR
ncbi:MAG: 2-dehydropantoate 2-reductase N-terminal domain-containing protein [Anaerolineales bacterium]|nr:MAG: 2-dehydropantoate 2-reductase N-terminal domain-containing protein [Anaerolineales bacterium]